MFYDELALESRMLSVSWVLLAEDNAYKKASLAGFTLYANDA